MESRPRSACRTSSASLRRCRLVVLYGGLRASVHEDRVEQAWRHGSVSDRLHIARGFRQLDVSPSVETRSIAAGGLSPSDELLRRNDVRLEGHAGKAVAAEMGRQTVIDADPVGL